MEAVFAMHGINGAQGCLGIWDEEKMKDRFLWWSFCLTQTNKRTFLGPQGQARPGSAREHESSG